MYAYHVTVKPKQTLTEFLKKHEDGFMPSFKFSNF